MRITARVDAWPELEKIADFGRPDCTEQTDPDDNGRARLETRDFDEVNYGGYDALKKAASAGFTFIASNGPGGEYGAGRQVAHDGQFLDQEEADGALFVQVDEKNGELTPGQLDDVRAFIAFEKTARAAMLARPAPEPTPEEEPDDDPRSPEEIEAEKIADPDDKKWFLGLMRSLRDDLSEDRRETMKRRIRRMFDLPEQPEATTTETEDEDDD